MKLAEQLAKQWQSRLASDCPNQSPDTGESIICWLQGENPDRFDTLVAAGLGIAERAMDFRFRIGRHRYLGVPPEQAYWHLIERLGSLVLLRQKVRTWVALSRDRQRSVVDVVREVIQEMLQADRYLQRANRPDCPLHRRSPPAQRPAARRHRRILPATGVQQAPARVPLCQLPAPHTARRTHPSADTSLGSASSAKK
jgi:hypothetical protein